MICVPSQNSPASFEKENKILCTWLFYKRQHLLCNLTFIILLTLTLVISWFTHKVQDEALQRQLQEARALKAELEVTLAEDEIRRKTEEFFEFKGKSLKEKKAKADEINDLVANIKARTMYVKTSEAVNIMEGLSNLALTLDPDSHMAKHQIAEVHFIHLNTVETKKMLRHYTPDSAKLLKVYQDCPSLNFNRRKRPSQQELIEFLKAMHYNEFGHILAQRAVLYDYEMRGRTGRPILGYEEVVRAYFEAGGKVLQSFVYDYDKLSRRLTIEIHNQDINKRAPSLFF